MHLSKKSSDSKTYPSGSFMGRLKERKIIATFVAFIGGGWLIYEVVHWILVDHYHMPKMLKDITIITFIGALLSTVIWLWFRGAEKRPGNVKVEILVVPLIILLTLVIDLRLIFQMTGLSINMLLIGIVALCLGIAWVVFKSLQWAASVPEAGRKFEAFKATEEKTAGFSEWKNSIAVLPFTNISADPEQEYFCDGISEELINSLTQISDLRIVARTSAFSFKGKDVDIEEIGRKLKVDKVLEGSVRKVGNRLRITAQLINVSDGYHLWSERYDREMEDVFVIQDEITLAIVDKLKIKLFGKERQELVKRHTDDQEAYSFYLKGRYFWNKMNPVGYKKAIENFELAIEKDPNNAVAYAGLADSYWWSSFWGNLPPHQTFPIAREAIQKAIEIDDSLGQAHASLALIHTVYDWDWEAAEREFKRALELAPNSSYTCLYYSFYLNLQRRHDEAVIQARKVQEFDPVSGISHIHLGHRLWQARRYDEAIEEFQKWLLIEPNDWFVHHHLSQVYLEKSMIKEAIVAIDKSLELSGGVPMNVANAAMIHYRFGNKEVADRLFDSLKKRASHEYIQPIGFVLIYLARGELDKAFEWIQKAHEERDSFLPWFRVTPLDCMHFPSDPRIDELLDRLGLP